jgi:hypothetical protein
MLVDMVLPLPVPVENFKGYSMRVKQLEYSLKRRKRTQIGWIIGVVSDNDVQVLVRLKRYRKKRESESIVPYFGWDADCHFHADSNFT